MSGSFSAFPSHLACVLYLAVLPMSVQMRVIGMLLPCQVVMMLAENVCGVPAECWTGVRAPRCGHGDANRLSKYRRP